MRYKYFKISMHVIVSFLSEGEHHFKALEGIPLGSRFIRMDCDHLGYANVVIEHESFPELKQADPIPMIEPRFEKLGYK